MKLTNYLFEKNQIVLGKKYGIIDWFKYFELMRKLADKYPKEFEKDKKEAA